MSKLICFGVTTRSGSASKGGQGELGWINDADCADIAGTLSMRGEREAASGQQGRNPACRPPGLIPAISVCDQCVIGGSPPSTLSDTGSFSLAANRTIVPSTASAPTSSIAFTTRNPSL